MYKCPNCGGELEFKPGDQVIRCQYCGTEFSPDELNEKAQAKSAKANNVIEGTVYTCSQCGGQILCNDDTGVTFCSYCGSQAILSEKIEAEAPNYIIPFIITKEKCESIYREKIKKAWFIPAEFKKDTTIEKFRGIYMPYWIMSGKSKYSQIISTEQYSRTVELGKEYDVTKFYDVDVRAEGFYDGIVFDSTSSLPDDISESIQPFDIRKAMDYDASYMAGFYTDVGDVPEDVYFPKAERLIKKWTTDAICKDSNVKRYGTTEDDVDNDDIGVGLYKSKKGFFPIWFLSVKNASGKMSYAVINGVNGKMYMDLPIDYKKYLLISLCAAVPAFLILLLFTMVPKVLLCIIMLFLAISGYFSIKGARELYVRRHDLNDWGKKYAKKEEMPELVEEKTTSKKRKTGCSIGILFIVVPIVLAVISALSGLNLFSILVPALFIVVIVSIIVSTVKNKTKSGGGSSDTIFKYKIPPMVALVALIPAFIGILLAGAVLIIAPASDLFYYLASVVCIAILCVIVLMQVNDVNALSLRKPAQLGKRGGDEVE